MRSSRAPALHASQKWQPHIYRVLAIEKNDFQVGIETAEGEGEEEGYGDEFLGSYADLFAPALAHCWVRPARLPHELAIWDWWGEPKRAAFQQVFFHVRTKGSGTCVFQLKWFCSCTRAVMFVVCFVPFCFWTRNVYTSHFWKTVQNRFRHVWIDFGEGSFCAYFTVKCIFLTSLWKLVVSPDFNPQSLFGDYFLDQYPNSNFFLKVTGDQPKKEALLICRTLSHWSHWKCWIRTDQPRWHSMSFVSTSTEVVSFYGFMTYDEMFFFKRSPKPSNMSTQSVELHLFFRNSPRLSLRFKQKIFPLVTYVRRVSNYQ